MYPTLFRHQLKKTLRSKYFTQGIAVKILIGFLAIYLIGSFLLLGIAMPEILAEVAPNAEFLTPVFVGFWLYYLGMDLAMRFFLQDLSVISIQHYLTQPLKKTTVIHYLLQGSIFNLFNLFPLLILVPFAIRQVSSEYSPSTAVLWLLAMFLLVLFNHFLAIYIKRILAVKQWVFFVFLGILAFCAAGDSLGWFSLREVSRALFAPLAARPILIVLPLAAMGLAYWLNFRFLKTYTHLDRWADKTSEATGTERFSFLESRGILGTMVANELKLITRNKRTKSLLYVAPLVLLYGLYFWMQEEFEDGYMMLLFVGIFMIGIIMINYGQFLVGWEGKYFDGILTRAYPMQDFFKAKFWLLVIACLIFYLFSLGFIFFGIKAFWINTAAFLYNIGVNTFVMLYASTYQKKPIDMSKGSAFNFQGVSAVQYIIVIPLIVVPILMFQAFNVFGRPYFGLAFLGFLGLLSLACHKYWSRAIESNFREKKYRNAAGFREG